jgi:hypothetical protein
MIVCRLVNTSLYFSRKKRRSRISFKVMRKSGIKPKYREVVVPHLSFELVFKNQTNSLLRGIFGFAQKLSSSGLLKKRKKHNSFKERVISISHALLHDYAKCSPAGSRRVGMKWVLHMRAIRCVALMSFLERLGYVYRIAE